MLRRSQCAHTDLNKKGIKRLYHFLFDIKGKDRLRWAYCCIVVGSFKTGAQVWIRFSKMSPISWIFVVDSWGFLNDKRELQTIKLILTKNSIFLVPAPVFRILFSPTVEQLALNKRIPMFFIKWRHIVLCSATLLNTCMHSAFAYLICQNCKNNDDWCLIGNASHHSINQGQIWGILLPFSFMLEGKRESNCFGPSVGK